MLANCMGRYMAHAFLLVAPFECPFVDNLLPYKPLEICIIHAVHEVFDED